MQLNRIRQSLTARTQNWKSKHFDLTKEGRKIARYKNIHQGERCFIIGNGPSLRAEDLQVLHDNGIVTFATNRIFHIFDKTSWRPTYFASEDNTILKSIQTDISGIECVARFVPINLKWYEDVNIQNATHFYLDYNSPYTESYGLSLDAARGIRCCGTVTITCIQLAVYMGFKEIYLLGVDHNYSKYTDANGNVVENPEIKDYFSEKYDLDFKNSIARDLGGTTRAFFSVEQLSRKNKSFKVYNATRGGKLEVFERVNFDTLFQDP